jgi:hypothetical protein
MRERAAFVAAAVVLDLRPGVAGVLEAERGERAQRLHLPHHRHPGRDARTAARPPGFEGDGELGAPEQQQGEGEEELVLP